MAFANSTVTDIITTTIQSRTGMLADNVTNNNALLRRLKERGNVKTFSGGNVILQEIGAYEDTPDEVVFDMVMETAYAGGAIGRRILGTPKTVRAQNRETMRDFLNRNYWDW